jgi:putative iron-dependent peroxidase
MPEGVTDFAFIDGTENPSLSVAPEVALIPEGMRGARGSVVLVQKWTHDAAAFEVLSIPQQEKVIGRSKDASIELDEKIRDSQSHVSRTVLAVNGAYYFVLPVDAL